MIRFALPNIVMMVFMSLYTIVDGMFISRLVGTLALSAVNMSYPLSSLQLALGIMLGTGGSAVIAREMGEGKDALAREDFSCIVAVALGTGVVFALAGNFFLGPILELLGTSEVQMPYTVEYTRILLWFAPAMFLQTVFQVLFVTAGKPTLGLGTTVAGGISNVVLDYLFMAPLHSGVAGAAIATGIGYCIPAAAGLWYFCRPRDSALWFTRFHPRRRMLLQTCGNGSSEMVSNIATAITTFLFNILFLRFWGEDGVASITIAMYFQFVFTAVFFGFSMGVAPVFSFNRGAGRYDRMRRIFGYCLRFILVSSVAILAVALALSGVVVGIFSTPGSPVYAIALDGFRRFAPAFLFAGVNIFSSALFTALSDGRTSAIISFARTFGFLLLGLLLLPRLLEVDGVWLAVPLAELLSCLLSVWFLRRKRADFGFGGGDLPRRGGGRI